MGKSDEWYTPKYIFDALNTRFDVDVAAPVDRKFCHVPADHFLTEKGLEKEWNGFVWCNPPYGHNKDKTKWMNKMYWHGNGIALMPDRTSAPWWQNVARQADMILFVSGKIKFIRPDGSIGEQPGNGTCLFGFGEKSMQILVNSNLGITVLT